MLLHALATGLAEGGELFGVVLQRLERGEHSSLLAARKPVWPSTTMSLLAPTGEAIARRRLAMY